MTDRGTPTPGPWEVDTTSGARVLATDGKGSFPICDIRGWGHLTGKGHGALGLSEAEAIAIQDANARLIAAAPDMLEAIEQALDDMGAESHSVCEQAKQMLRAALVKATREGASSR